MRVQLVSSEDYDTLKKVNYEMDVIITEAEWATDYLSVPSSGLDSLTDDDRAYLKRMEIMGSEIRYEFRKNVDFSEEYMDERLREFEKMLASVSLKELI